MALDPITAVLNLGSSIIDKIWPDKTEAEKAKIKLFELSQAGEFKQLDALLEQVKVNIEEAKSQSLFVSGWRPAVGWICGSAIFYHYVFEPFLYFILNAFGVTVSLPVLDTGELMTLLLGMLGLGVMRSYDNREKLRTNGNGGTKQP